jgi:hypothetical protein
MIRWSGKGELGKRRQAEAGRLQVVVDPGKVGISFVIRYGRHLDQDRRRPTKDLRRS